jgi:hypothetical protein
MSKGALFVNGQALGRFWSIASVGDNCSPTDCRYNAGPYEPTHCGEDSSGVGVLAD